MIAKEKIQQLVTTTEIVELIGNDLSLQKKGRNFIGVCPFHEDQTPSLTVSPEKKIYKCFACNASGDALDWVINYHQKDFISALQFLSEKTGLQLPELSQRTSNAKYSEKQMTLFALNQKALQFYQVLLASQDGLTAQNYLKQRSLTKKEIQTWEIGFANPKVPLHTIFLKQGVDLEQLQQAGLIVLKDGKVHDYFINRVLFPIKNEDGMVIGFSGRALDETQKPKYLNTSETLIFKKNEIFFNFHQVRQKALNQKKILLLEGFMDVISLQRLNIENAVALMGTNLSSWHLKTLKKMKLPVILFLDGDRPGTFAALKMAQMLLKNQVPVQIINNFETSDPDELICQGQGDKIQEMLKNPLEPALYAIKKLAAFYNLQNTNALRQYLQIVFEILKLNQDLIVQEQCFQALAQITKLSPDVLTRSFAQQIGQIVSGSESTSPFSKVSKNGTQTTKPFTNYEFSEREILHSLITSQANLKKIAANLNLIINPQLRAVLEELIKRYQAGNYQANNWTELIQIAQAAAFDYQNPVWGLQLEALIKLQQQPINLDNAFLALEEYRLKTKEIECTEKIKTTTNLENQKNLINEREKIRTAIIELRKKRH